jgi:uncharacterized protein with HEPN domain
VTKRPFDDDRRDSRGRQITSSDLIVSDALAEGRHVIELAASLVARYTYEEFMADELLHNSASMLLIRLREVANRLPDQFKESHPDVPWRTIIGMGNIMAHQYSIRADPHTVWATLTNDLPRLGIFAAPTEN